MNTKKTASLQHQGACDSDVLAVLLWRFYSNGGKTRIVPREGSASGHPHRSGTNAVYGLEWQGPKAVLRPILAEASISLTLLPHPELMTVES